MTPARILVGAWLGTLLFLILMVWGIPWPACVLAGALPLADAMRPPKETR